MTLPEYPTGISEHEQSLGFELIELQNPSGHGISLDWVSVVAKILSESDIIIKTCLPSGDVLIYKHRRFGVMSDIRGQFYDEPPVWHAVGADLFSDPQKAIIEASFGSDELTPYIVRPSRFEFHKA
jgi:hypothetical protein